MKKLLKQHRGDIMRPSTTRDSRGQISGDPTIIASGVPFGLKPLAGREREIARQEFAQATVRVELTAAMDWVLTPKDYIMRRTGPKNGKALNIGFIQDAETNGVDTVLICGEGDL